MSSSRLFRLSAMFVPCTWIALSAATATGADRRNDPTTLTIMTFNAEFLWDGNPPEEGQANFSWKGSPDEAREHMSRVAEVIKRSNPDIVNLVELENLNALQQLNDEFLAGYGYIAYLDPGTDTYTGQDVGILTRVDPEGGAIRYDNREGQSGQTRKKVSKNYVARFSVDGRKIAMIGLHLLAQPNREDRKAPREAQIDAIRSMAREQVTAGHDLVVLGDFNDYDGADCCRDHINSQPKSQVMDWIRQMNPAVNNDDLVNVASLVPQALRYTSFWDQNDDGLVSGSHELTSIDHVLLSPGLASLIQTVEFPHVDVPGAVSDHFPIVVRFRLNGDSPSPPPGSHAMRISSLLANPPGDERIGEWVRIENVGSTPISLSGWKLRDRGQKTWSLDSLGTISPGTQIEVGRNSQPMTLNNDGDRIELCDSSGAVIDVFTYSAMDEGEIADH